MVTGWSCYSAHIPQDVQQPTLAGNQNERHTVAFEALIFVSQHKQENTYAASEPFVSPSVAFMIASAAWRVLSSAVGHRWE